VVMRRNDLKATAAAEARDIALARSPAPRLREKKKVRGFRMGDSEWNRLVAILDRKGLSTAGGLRMIVTEWMERSEREGLR